MTLQKIFEIIENAYKILPWWQSILIYLGIGLLMLLALWLGLYLVNKIATWVIKL